MGMAHWQQIIFICVALSLAAGERATDNPRMVRVFKRFLNTISGKTVTIDGLAEAKKNGKLQEVLPQDTPFPCDVSKGRSIERPTSVHKLRPGDIDVIGSIGDSLSAGNGLAASRLVHISIDNRGLSWVIGGRGDWRQYLSLPNIIKEFNPNLTGFAQEDAYGFMPDAQLSVSEPGAMSRDMPHAAKILVQRIKQNAKIDFKKDWKLVNFFIGGNDFCVDVCFLTERDMRRSSEVHRQDLIRTFDYLRDNLPRTIVNVILAPSEIMKSRKLTKGCPTEEQEYDIIRNLFVTSCPGELRNAIEFIQKYQKLQSKMGRFECPCLFGEVHKHRFKQMVKLQDEWIKVQKQVGVDSRYRTKEDFALVIQPFVPKSRIPKFPSGKSDLSFVSTDCFHFSQKGGARAANTLWNNMVEPVGTKSQEWEPTYQRFLCPSEQNPYIFTWANSGFLS